MGRTPTVLSIYYAFVDGKGHTINDISSRVNLTKRATQFQLYEGMTRGYIHRRKDDCVWRYWLTEKGKEAVLNAVLYHKRQQEAIDKCLECKYPACVCNGNPLDCESRYKMYLKKVDKFQVRFQGEV